MLTRRVILAAAPVAMFATHAGAVRPLADNELRELYRMQALTTDEAARLQRLMPKYAQLAEANRSSDAALSAKLVEINLGLDRARAALTAAVAAFPAEARPRVARSRLPPVVLAPQQQPRLTQRGGLPSRNVTTVTPAPVAAPELTVNSVAMETRLRPSAWRAMADGVRVCGRISGLDFERTASQYETVATYMQSAHALVLDVSLQARVAEHQSNDRLGNFEIQDLMSRVRQNDTLASDLLKQLNDTAAGAQQRL